ncbi:MAG: TonB-dependent receptor, partial [Sphingobacterium sp.]
MMKDLLLLIAVILTNFATVQAQKTSGDLTGYIADKEGNPVENVTVELIADANKSIHKAKSNSQGNFSFTQLPTGDYLLKATHVSYQATNQKIEIQAAHLTVTSLVIQPISDLKEVVVTAGRKAESIDEVPSSITILSEKEVQQQMNINTSVSAVLGNTIPGLGTSTKKATNNGQTLIGRQVLVLIDGIPQSTPLMNGARDIRTLDPAIIQKVEVIKGATSIYGNGSGGGIINFITKTPVSDKAFAGMTTIGSRSNLAHAENTIGYRVSQLFEGSINKFSYVISGAYDYLGVQKDAKGFVNAQGDGLGESSLYNTFVKLNYKPNDKSSLVASYNLFRSTQNRHYINQVGTYLENPSIGIKGDDPGEPAGTPYNHNVLLSYNHQNLPLGTMLDITGYYNQFISVNRYVANSTSWYGAGQTKIQSFKKGIRLNLNTPWHVHENFEGEITYGLDLLNDRTNQVLTDGRVYIPDMDMVNLAPYAQIKFDLWENLILKGGLRYENAKVRVEDFNTIASGPEKEGSIAVSGGKIPYKATMFNAG